MSKETPQIQGTLASFFERRFQLNANKTTVRTELWAGVATFLSMAYILAVNPSLLALTGMNASGVFVATVLAAVVGTLIMAFHANYPFALAPGMGLNAYLVYSIVLGMGYSWQFALFAVFLEGLIFIVLTLTKAREAIFDAIPQGLRIGVGTGIGLFLAFIGLQNARLIVHNEATLVAFTTFDAATIHTSGICGILALVGFVLIAVMSRYKIRGSILLGVVATWILGMICQATGVYRVDVASNYFSLYPTFSSSTSDLFSGFREVFLAAFDVSNWTKNGSEISGWRMLFSFNVFLVVFALFFVDFFDTLGTVVALAVKGKLYDSEGKLPRIRNVLLADAVATTAGAALGTSTTTTFLESSTGVAQGGKTGLTALTVAALFLLSIVFSPVFLAVPSFATSTALLYVGFLMTSTLAELDFDDLTEAAPAFVACAVIPLAYSISEGIALGYLSWVAINIFSGGRKKISPLAYGLTALFIAKYVLL